MNGFGTLHATPSENGLSLLDIYIFKLSLLLLVAKNPTDLSMTRRETSA